MGRPRSGRFLSGFCLFVLDSGNSSRCGGNVGIRRRLPDSQGVGETGENLLLVFPGFHGTAISTALRGFGYSRVGIRGGWGDSILQVRNTFAFAAPILLANSVSLIAAARLSRASIVIPGLRYSAAPGNDFSF